MKSTILEFERHSCQTKGEATRTAWCGYCVKPNQKGLDTKLVQTPKEKQLCMKHIQKKVRKTMTHLTTLKISLFSVLATLFLLVGMLASSGTASAHTASSQATA